MMVFIFVDDYICLIGCFSSIWCISMILLLFVLLLGFSKFCVVLLLLHSKKYTPNQKEKVAESPFQKMKEGSLFGPLLAQCWVRNDDSNRARDPQADE